MFCDVFVSYGIKRALLNCNRNVPDAFADARATLRIAFSAEAALLTGYGY
jgi:hypothetical protein